MTCFWDGILSLLHQKELKSVLNVNDKDNVGFINGLKKHNIKTVHVTWNVEKLSEKQHAENHEHIKNIDVLRINDGYLCSSYDPVLFLIAELFFASIKHNYKNHVMRYARKNAKIELEFASDTGHFWSVKRTDVKDVKDVKEVMSGGVRSGDMYYMKKYIKYKKKYALMH
jgi:hypothetical protein